MTSVIEMTARRRHAAVTLALATLVAWIFLSFGHLGFSPTDEGYMLAYSHRLLRGEMPHQDFSSPAPVGSPLLHLLDLALPLPMLEASRLIAVIEIVAYSTWLAMLTFGRPLSRWGPLDVLGVVAATLVNLHVFPLMAWYTIEGLAIASAGFVLVTRGLDRGRRGSVLLGLLALGTAPLMKQSFFAAPALGVALAWAASGRMLTAALSAALPVALYVGIVAVSGGFPELLQGLARVPPPTGARLLDPLRTDERWGLLALMALTAMARWTLHAAERTGNRAGGPMALRRAFAWLPGIIGSVMVGAILLDARLEWGGSWGLLLVWMLIALIAADLGSAHDVERAPVILLALAGMVMLSLGYPVPNLVAGSIALHLVSRMWGVRCRVPPPLTLAVTLAGLAALLPLTSAARRGWIYLDRPAPFLTERLSDIAPAFGAIRTNPVTATYLRELADCIARYPATRTSVLPDNPFVYPVFNLTNPFPTDWMGQRITHGPGSRILDVARRLDADGDYTVLFQTFNVFRLASMGSVPAASPQSVPYSRTGVEGRLVEILAGERSACGSFLVIHSPPRAR